LCNPSSERGRPAPSRSWWSRPAKTQPTSHFGDPVYNQQVTMTDRKVAKSAVNYEVKIYHYISLQYTGCGRGRYAARPTLADFSSAGPATTAPPGSVNGCPTI